MLKRLSLGALTLGVGLLAQPAFASFHLMQIEVPVLLRYGLTDVLVPPGHGHWLAATIPGCEVRIEDEAGHFAQDPARTVAESLEWLRHCANAESSVYTQSPGLRPCRRSRMTPS